MLKKVIFSLALLNVVLFGMSLDELNSASKAELMKVKKVGALRAELIIKAREKSKFKSFDDLQKRVKGVGSAISNSIKEYKLAPAKEKKDKVSLRHKRK